MSEVYVPESNQHAALPERTDLTRGPRIADEDRAWAQLYAAVLQGEPCTAEEVIKALDADPKSKHIRLALYTQAKTTLRKHKVVAARNQRVGAFVRITLSTLVMGPWRMLRAVFSPYGAIAVEIVPPVRREPAKSRVPALMGDPEFDRSTHGTTVFPEPTGQEDLRNTKAA